MITGDIDNGLPGSDDKTIYKKQYGAVLLRSILNGTSGSIPG
jgi:hypothetical protein